VSLAEVVRLHRDSGAILIPGGLVVAAVGPALEWSADDLILQLVAALIMCAIMRSIVRRQVRRDVDRAIENRRPMPIDVRQVSRARTLGHAAVYAASISVGVSLLLVFAYLLTGFSGAGGVFGGLVLAMGVGSLRFASAAEAREDREGGRLWFEPDSSFILGQGAGKAPLYWEPLDPLPAQPAPQPGR
jgi:uncharacterized membrane protein YfcA